MNKSTKTFLPTLILILILVISSLFVFVFTKSEVRRMLRTKDYMQEKLTEKINLIEARLVEKQRLNAEERIVELAQNKLFMLKNPDKPKIINISKEKLSEVQELIKYKYE